MAQETKTVGSKIAENIVTAAIFLLPLYLIAFAVKKIYDAIFAKAQRRQWDKDFQLWQYQQRITK